MRLAIRILTVLGLGVIAAAAAVGVTMLQPVRYQSTSELVVTGTSPRGLEPAIRSLEALIVSPPVTADIAARAHVDLTSAGVLDRMSVDRPPASAVLQVSVLDTNRDVSAALAREAGPALAARVANLPPAPGQDASIVGVVAVDDDPTTTTVEPDRLRNGAIGLGIGLLLGAGVAFWFPRRERPVRSVTDPREALHVPVYATLPLLASGSRRTASLHVPVDALPADWPPAARRQVVVSRGGRSSVHVVQLLAGTLARNGRHVLLIDAEPEERLLTSTLGQLDRLGFFDCVMGRTDVATATVALAHGDLPQEMSSLVPPDGGRISLLPAGEVDVAPADLGADRVLHVLRQVPVNTTVVLHAPTVPGRFAADPFLTYADDVVVPVLGGRTRAEEAQSVVGQISSLTGAPVRVVLLTERPGKRPSSADGGHGTVDGSLLTPRAGGPAPASLAPEH